MVEKHYPKDPDQVELLPGAREIVRAAKEHGWGVAVVSNQSGVARGLLTAADVKAVNGRLAEMLGEDIPFFFCSHGPDEGCECRKPRPGLLYQVRDTLGADLAESIMVGDKASDLHAGRAVGARTALVRTGYGEGESPDAATFIGETLNDVRRWMGEVVRVRKHFDTSIATMTAVRQACLDDLLVFSEAIAKAMETGKKLLICGNGGSAADSQHLAAEFVVRLTADFERPALPAIALTVDTSTLTAFGNDYGFERVFARQVEALGQPGDVLLAISTSGGSANVVRAVEAANAQGVITLGLLGGSGGQLKDLVDHALVVPSPTTMHVQESHLALYHLLCALVERRLFPIG